MSDNNTEQKKALSRLWNLYSALFCQPEPDVHGDNQIYSELFKNLEIALPGKVDPKKLFKEYQNCGQQNLLVEYTRLFIGPFKTVAPPYSSVYLSNDGTVFNEVTQQVLNFYQESGLNFDYTTNELPDHIVVELEFMHYLSSQEINEIESGNIEKANALFNLQKIFMNEHLMCWYSFFCERIILGTENNYYKSLAECFKQFIDLSNFRNQY